jgi:hypothetical protein
MNIGDKITIKLPEVQGDGEILCQIALGKDGLTIHPEGMGVYDGDYPPILIERYQGEIRLVYWADINEQEPTIVDLSAALESNRRKVKDDYENGECPDCGEPIPDDAWYGGNCDNCEHVWNEPREGSSAPNGCDFVRPDETSK